MHLETCLAAMFSHMQAVSIFLLLLLLLSAISANWSICSRTLIVRSTNSEYVILDEILDGVLSACQLLTDDTIHVLLDPGIEPVEKGHDGFS